MVMGVAGSRVHARERAREGEVRASCFSEAGLSARRRGRLGGGDRRLRFRGARAVTGAFRLDDRVALVTGSASGIGAATARVFADAGADVVAGW